MKRWLAAAEWLLPSAREDGEIPISWSALQLQLLAAVCALAALPPLVALVQNGWLELGMWRAAVRLGGAAYGRALVALVLPGEFVFALAMLAARRLPSLRAAVAFSAMSLLLGVALNLVLNRIAVSFMVDVAASFANVVHHVPTPFEDRMNAMVGKMLAPLLDSPRELLPSLVFGPGAAWAVSLAYGLVGAGAAALIVSLARRLRRRRLPSGERRAPAWGRLRFVSRQRLGAVGFLLLPVAVLALRAQAARHVPRGRPNVVLVSIDTLRADFLGAYGHASETSPAIDRVAREGLLFERAVSASSWTLPSHATMLTGLYPMEHRCNLVQGLTLSTATLTLAERLVDAGYRTIGVSGSFFVSPIYGLDQGFERWYYRQTTADHLVDRAIDEIQASDDRPFFLFLHLFDPHDPYTPPEAYREHFLPAGEGDDVDGHVDHAARAAGELARDDRKLAALRHLYEAEIRYTDDQLSRLFGRLRESRRLDDTLLIVTADHGESFGENGVVGHGGSLFSPQTHVPLVLRYPKRIPAGARRSEVVEAGTRLAPTILRLLELEPLREGGPPSLLDEGDAGPVFGETSLGFLPLYSVQDESFKLIVPLYSGALLAGSAQLFDQRADWGDATDLAASMPEKVNELVYGPLRAHLARSTRPVSRGSPVSLTPEDLDRLRSLGYVR